MSEQTKNVNFALNCKQEFTNWHNYPDSPKVVFQENISEGITKINKKEAQHEQ